MTDSLGMLYDLMNESKSAATYYIEMVSIEIDVDVVPLLNHSIDIRVGSDHHLRLQSH
jgi:hypothetical protein